MLLKLATLLIPISMFLGISHSQINNNVLMKTRDFIDSFNTTSIKITLNQCWSKNDQKLFWKLFSVKFPVIYARKLKNHYVKDTNQLYIIDLSCNKSLDFLKQAQHLNLFKIPNKWLLYGSSNNLLDLYFRADSEIFIINPTNDHLEFKTIYKISENDKEFVESTLASYADFSLSQRTNLRNHLLKTSYVVTNLDTLNHLTDYRDTHIDAPTKINYLLLKHLIVYLNATQEDIIRRTWGYKNSSNGLYNGMVGDLQNGIADLGGTALFFLEDRIEIIDYSAPTTPTNVKFILKAPPLSYVKNVFVLPFNSSVWLYCIIMVIIVVIFLYFVVLWEWKEKKFRKNLEKSRDALNPNFFDVIMLQIGAITQQGSDVEPKSTSGRIITIFTFLTLMFLYTSYSANIVALLQSTAESIQTLDDLLNSRIQLGAEEIVYNHYYFENAKEPIRKAIYTKKIAPKNQKSNFLDAKEGIERVQKEFFAFHIELTTGYKIISKTFHESEKCALREIAYENFITPWIAIPKKSPYREIIKVGMKKMHESGIQNREVRRIYSKKPQCLGGYSNFGSVGLIDCYCAFLIFGIGLSSAILMTLLEIIFNKFQTHKK